MKYAKVATSAHSPRCTRVTRDCERDVGLAEPDIVGEQRTAILVEEPPNAGGSVRLVRVQVDVAQLDDMVVSAIEIVKEIRGRVQS